MAKYKAMKMKIGNSTVSRAVQDDLFKQGYRWAGSSRDDQSPDYEFVNMNFLYTSAAGEIMYSTDSSYFENSKGYEEVTVITTTKLVVAEFKVKERPKMVVLGKTYFRQDVEAALAKLEVAVV